MLKLSFPYKLWSACEVTPNYVLEVWLRLYQIYIWVWGGYFIYFFKNGWQYYRGEYFKTCVTCVLLILSPGQNLNRFFLPDSATCHILRCGQQGEERLNLWSCEENTMEGPLFPAIGIFQGQKCVEFQGLRILGYKKKLHFKGTRLKKPCVNSRDLCPACEFSGATRSYIQFNSG